MAQLGFHGKVPAVGDFVSRGFSRPLCQALDDWLQAALQAAQQGGATRESLERHAVPVLLHLKPGALCPSGFLGALVPSSDRVGRFFPLCIGLEQEAGDPFAGLLWPSLAMAVALCRIGIEAQQELLGPDALQARLTELPPAAEWNDWLQAAQPFRTAEDITLPGLPESMQRLAFQGPEARMQGAQRATCSHLPPSFLAAGALITQADGFDVFFASRASPLRGADFAALFDGRWTAGGWVWFGPPDDDETRPPAAPAQAPAEDSPTC
ncbi:type VI secretion system-associated protein TagF [Inhella sp.]|uniref:type VI secretion system-associated protein TagF n=1 Tax=Inhella sp. TaxID=1921806 RepID=UPI0035B006A0